VPFLVDTECVLQSSLPPVDHGREDDSSTTPRRLGVIALPLPGSHTSARPAGATIASALVTPVLLTAWRSLMFRSLMHKITRFLANEKHWSTRSPTKKGTFLKTLDVWLHVDSPAFQRFESPADLIAEHVPTETDLCTPALSNGEIDWVLTDTMPSPPRDGMSRRQTARIRDALDLHRCIAVLSSAYIRDNSYDYTCSCHDT
jgi:hypothetical protein